MKLSNTITAAIAGMGLAVSPLIASSAFAQDAEAEPEAPASEVPPPNLDTNGDGTADAWDLNDDGKPDVWDTNGDGQPDAWDRDGNNEPDAFDTDGDGQPDSTDMPKKEESR